MSAENPKTLTDQDRGKMPGGLSGNLGREGIEIGSFAAEAHVEPDGSGYLVIYHGGLNQKFLFSDQGRRDLIIGLGGTPT